MQPLINNDGFVDQEAIALAACYRLLLQKARERRERLAQETAVAQDNPKTPTQEDHHDHDNSQH